MFFKKILLVILIVFAPLHIIFANYIFTALPIEIKQKHIKFIGITLFSSALHVSLKHKHF